MYVASSKILTTLELLSTSSLYTLGLRKLVSPILQGRSNNKFTMYWDSLYYELNVVEFKVEAITLDICI